MVGRILHCFYKGRSIRRKSAEMVGSCDLELLVACASWSIVTLFRSRRATEARGEQAMIAEVDRIVGGGFLRGRRGGLTDR